jgi:nitrogen fixation protein NifU and related proteins
MPGLEDLYREIILDHYRNPRNRGELPVPPAHVETGFNPLCGDEITVYLELEDDRVANLKLGGQGCSISQSSASMMSTAVKGKTLDEARATIRTFKRMMSVHEHRLDSSEEGQDAPAEVEVPLGDLEALQGVVKFPVRIKCATLSWNTLVQALDTAEQTTAEQDLGARDNAARDNAARDNAAASDV